MTFPFEAYYTDPSSPTMIIGATEDTFPVLCSYLNLVCDRWDIDLHFEVTGEEEELDPSLEQFLRWMTFADYLNASQLNSALGSADLTFESADRQMKAISAWNTALTYWNKYRGEKEYVCIL